MLGSVTPGNHRTLIVASVPDAETTGLAIGRRDQQSSTSEPDHLPSFRLTDSLGIALIAAGASFGASIAGALVGGLSSPHLSLRREFREARSGARLVRLDLEGAARVIHQAITDGSATAVAFAPMPAWADQRPHLARQLSSEDWHLVAKAVTEAALVAGVFEGKEGSPVRTVAGNEQVAAWSELRDQLIDAYNALGPLSGDDVLLSIERLQDALSKSYAVGRAR